MEIDSKPITLANRSKKPEPFKEVSDLTLKSMDGASKEGIYEDGEGHRLFQKIYYEQSAEAANQEWEFLIAPPYELLMPILIFLFHNKAVSF
jgi:hypothetical protein